MQSSSQMIMAAVVGMAVYWLLVTPAKFQTEKMQSDDVIDLPLMWAPGGDNSGGYGPRPRVDQKLIGEGAMYVYNKPELEPMDTASMFVEGPYRKRPSVW